MKKFNAIIYDMDGLMIDSEPLWRKAEIKLFKTVGITLTEDDCRTTMGLRIDEVVEHWFSRYPWDTKTKENLENEIVEEVGRLIEAEGALLKGVKSSIEYFYDAGCKLAVASSSKYVLIEQVVKAFNLGKDFSVLHSAEEEAYGKPHPAVFIKCAKKLEVLPNECLVFEDSLHGVVAAKAAKMAVVAVPERQEINNPKFSIADAVWTDMSGIDEKFMQLSN